MRHARILLRSFFSASLLLFPAIVAAQDDFVPLICSGLFGCGQGPDDVISQHALPTIGLVLVQMAGGGAIIAIVVAGVQMLTSYGDEGKVTNARKGIMFALGGLALALTATTIVSFISTEDYGLTGGEGTLLSVMAAALRIILILFNVALAIVVILAGIRMVNAGGNSDEFKKAGLMIKWAIIGAVVVNIARALVQALLALNL